MIRYILLNPGDVIGPDDEMLATIEPGCRMWLPAPAHLIGLPVRSGENPCRRPLSRAGLPQLAEEAAREK